MANKYDNIDFLVNTLRDFAYEDKKCYVLDYPTQSEIDVGHLKMDESFDFSEVFKGPIKLRESVAGMPTFEGKVGNNKIMIRVGIYNGATDNMRGKELIDMKCSYLLSNFGLNTPLKFILLPIVNFDVPVKKLEKMAPVIFSKMKEHAGEEIAYVQVYENFHPMMTLREYVKVEKQVPWKELLFQIFYGLAVIQKSHDSFRHNKLDVDHILVSNVDEIEKTISLRGINFKFKSRFMVKITGFYESYSHDIALNKDTAKRQKNGFYDVHHIMSSIYQTLHEDGVKFTEYSNIYNNIIPNQFRVTETRDIELDEARYLDSVTIMDPFLILTKNNFFTEFIRNTINKMDSDSTSNSPRDVKSYGKKTGSVNYDSPISDGGSRVLARLAENEVKSKGKKSASKKTIHGKRRLASPPKVERTTRTRSSKPFYDTDVFSATSEMNGVGSERFSETSFSESVRRSSVAPTSSASRPRNNIFSAIESMSNSRGNSQHSANLESQIASHLPPSMQAEAGQIAVNMPTGSAGYGNILGQLPDGYEGQVPDWLQAQLPMAGEQGMGQQMNPMGMSQMRYVTPMNTQVDPSVFVPSMSKGTQNFNPSIDTVGSAGMPNSLGSFLTETGSAVNPLMGAMSSQQALASLPGMQASQGIPQGMPQGMSHGMAGIPGFPQMGGANDSDELSNDDFYKNFFF